MNRVVEIMTSKWIDSELEKKEWPVCTFSLYFVHASNARFINVYENDHGTTPTELNQMELGTGVLAKA
jgi:hypothetical protein